jgi:hypothetical protein
MQANRTQTTTLRITDRLANTTKTLKNKLLKDLENYSCAVRTFYTNATPPVLVDAWTKMLSIFPKDDLAAVIDIADPWVNVPIANALNKQALYQLDIKKNEFTSILTLAEKVSNFFKEFNRQLFIHGSTFGVNNLHHIAPNVLPPPRNDVTPDVTHVSFWIDSSGRAIFRCSPAFLSQFYIQLDSVLASTLGITPYIFAGMAAGPVALVTGFDRDAAGLYKVPFAVALPGVYQFSYTIHAVTGGLAFHSKNSFFLLDRRHTLVIEISMPFSRTVYAIDGEYKEKFRLAEFPLSDYVIIESKSQTQNGQVISKTSIVDSLQGGLTDYCKNNPLTHVIHFLPGDLEVANIRIYMEYRDMLRRVVEVPFDVGSGFYDLELIFCKKKKHGKQQQEPQRISKAGLGGDRR